MENIILTFLFSGFFSSYIYFTIYIFKGEIKDKNIVFHLVEFLMVVCLPIYFFYTEASNTTIDCCYDTPLLSAKYTIHLEILTVVFTLVYYYSVFRKNIAPPILEIFINAMLLIGIITNIIVAIQITDIDGLYFLIIIPPTPILFYIIRLGDNQKSLIKYFSNHNKSKNVLVNIGLSILSLNPFIKYPILLILCLPILLIFSSFLLLFGQQPDAYIRVFTETYKHGFSQLIMHCDNIDCGGHYLCSVAANGHTKVVKPIRLGKRNGGNIICNRQLLIANAFEELLQDKFPVIHKFIRHQYNKVGNVIHRHYWVFDNKYFSDFIYLLMKPLEWIFIIVLYSCDYNPENRIAKQYLPRK